MLHEVAVRVKVGGRGETVELVGATRRAIGKINSKVAELVTLDGLHAMAGLKR